MRKCPRWTRRGWRWRGATSSLSSTRISLMDEREKAHLSWMLSASREDIRQNTNILTIRPFLKQGPMDLTSELFVRGWGPIQWRCCRSAGVHKDHARGREDPPAWGRNKREAKFPRAGGRKNESQSLVEPTVRSYCRRPKVGGKLWKVGEKIFQEVLTRPHIFIF